MGCGEDRTHEYEEKTSRDHWMLEVMRQEYLWGASLQELAWKDYFAKPSDFFAKLTAQAPVTDTWSWCSTDTVMEDFHERGYFNHLDSYGLDLFIMTDPTGSTSRQYGRIMTVYEGSPAARSGLQRGDFISAIDGTKFTSNEAKKLKNGKARTLTVERLGFDETEGAFVWTETLKVELEASEYVEDVAFPQACILDGVSGKVGYLLCNRLTHGPIEKDAASKTYQNDLANQMAKFKGTEMSAFVLDLRLCNDGTLDMANLLASYFVDESKRGQVFAQTFYNENNSSKNTSFTFSETGISNRLTINKLYVITSAYTTGAAEWLVRGIRNAMGDSFVVLVGMKTSGQTVLTGSIPSEFYVTLHPAVAYVADANGDYDYSDGLSPDIEANEQTAYPIYAYGNPNEYLLNICLKSE